MANTRILKRCEKYDVVSFDMFDTLVKRNVKAPEDIFSHTQIAWNRLHPEKQINDYVPKRIRAYEKAEQIYHGICNIQEVYNYYSGEESEKSELIRLEVETELAFCTPNIPLVSLAKKMREMGKKVVIISDMYLSTDILSKVLSNCGMENGRDYDALYVSCDIRKRKTDGDLYQHVLKHLGVLAKNVIHIGDNWKNDYIRALQQGIYAIHIPTWQNNLSYYRTGAFSGEEQQQYDQLQVIANNMVMERENEFYKIGVEVFGPFMTGFALWLHNQFAAEKIDRIFFLAREGKIIMECYQMLFPEEYARISYMYASRRSIIVPSYSADSSYEGICTSIAPSRHLNIQDFFFRLNLDIRNYYEILERLSIPLDYTYSGYEMLNNEKLKTLYQYLQKDVAAIADKEYALLVKYFRQIGFVGKKVAIVDIGWNGGMQKALGKLSYLKENAIELHGYYAGINSKMMGTALENTHGYLYEQGKNDAYRYYIYGFAGPLEMALTATEGSTKCFRSENDRVIPVLLQSEYLGENGCLTREMASILQIQDGIRQYVRRYTAIARDRFPVISEKVAFASLYGFGTETKRKHLKLYENFGAIDLNVKQNMIGAEYTNLFGDKSIRKGLAISTWKIGFMKYIFRIPLPYKEVYRFLRKRVN